MLLRSSKPSADWLLRGGAGESALKALSLKEKEDVVEQLFKTPLAVKIDNIVKISSILGYTDNLADKLVKLPDEQFCSIITADNVESIMKALGKKGSQLSEKLSTLPNEQFCSVITKDNVISLIDGPPDALFYGKCCLFNKILKLTPEKLAGIMTQSNFKVAKKIYSSWVEDDLLTTAEKALDACAKAASSALPEPVLATSSEIEGGSVLVSGDSLDEDTGVS